MAIWAWGPSSSAPQSTWQFIGGDVLSATGDTFLILMITGAMIKVNADSAMARLKMEARIDRLEAALTENSTGEEA